MPQQRRFGRWNLDEKDLQDLSPVKARDLVIRCFYEAQKETFAMAKEKLHLPAGEQHILSSVISTIKSAFAEVGGDYEKPTVESLTGVVEVLAKKAAAWGTPPEIIEHHKGQIGLVIKRLASLQR
jgi:hypothetical protein